MHNLELSEEQALIQDTVKKLVQDSVAPHALERDEHRTFDGDGLAAMAELGLLGLPVAEARGGAGMGMVAFAVAVEELARESGSLARLLVTHAGQCGLALQDLDAAAADLAAIAGGEQPAAFVGPEHGVQMAGGKLSGKAELVTGAGEAALLIVAATQDGQPCLCAVDAKACQRTALRSLGFAAAAPARLEFAGVAARLLATGQPAGAAIAAAQTAAWIGGAALAVGMAAASVVLAHKHAAQRIAFGKPLSRQQAVQTKLVEGRRATDAARHLVYHAARLWEAGQAAEARQAAIAARLAAVEAAVLASDEGIQIHGGFGYTVEYHVERHYRDAKTLDVLDGGGGALREELARVQFAD